jgi:DNA-binding transcriptional LysR family regulator
LHQLRCFAATYDTGSFTAAAAELKLAQPSVAEQVRLLEQGLATALFQRAGRTLVATEAARVLRPHAERSLAAVTDATRAVASVREVVTGTIRFGVFGTARIYLTTDLAATVLASHPDVRLEIVGLNSQQVISDVRRGRLEAALVALPIDDADIRVIPVMRDEVVYVSADPDRVRRAVTAAQLAEAPLVLSEVSWGNADSTRRQLARMVQSVGRTLAPRAEVEDIDTALELAARGLGDTVTGRGLLYRLGERVPPNLRWTSLRPRVYDEFAVIHRRGSDPSPAVRILVETSVAHMRSVADAVVCLR